MFISISYVCVFVQYHQMAIPAYSAAAEAQKMSCTPTGGITS